MKTRLFLLAILVLLFLEGCSKISSPTTSILPPAVITKTVSHFPTLSPTATATMPPPTPTIELIDQVCSPIHGIGFSDLPLVQSWEFISSTPYVESGHPALDIGSYHFKDFSFFPNFPVDSIIAGKVILVEEDSFPYGNMILIETPLDMVNPVYLSSIPQPTPLPPYPYSEERCPVSGTAVTWDPGHHSMYVLYAHLLQKPDYEPGDPISCGQSIGTAGKSGHAAEEHLHLEIRIGPSNATFESIANYQPSANPGERYNYCIWALSGIFQAIDPANLLYP